jgi:hypothetical protein
MAQIKDAIARLEAELSRLDVAEEDRRKRRR